MHLKIIVEKVMRIFVVMVRRFDLQRHQRNLRELCENFGSLSASSEKKKKLLHPFIDVAERVSEWTLLCFSLGLWAGRILASISYFFSFL